MSQVASLLKLDGLLDRRPGTLSGGERRRVVLGRAVAKRPRILLLDEPFNGLDAPLRIAAHDVLTELHRQDGLTIILVTHDQAEAMALGDRIVVLDRGTVLQCASPSEVYQHPATVEVARFLGDPPMNLLPAQLHVRPGSTRLRLLGRDLPIAPGGQAVSTMSEASAERPVWIGLRAEDIEITNPETDTRSLARGTARRVEKIGNASFVVVEVENTILRVHCGTTPAPSPGDHVGLRFEPGAAAWFDHGTGRRLPPCNRVESA